MSYVPPHLRSSTKTLEINGNNYYTNSHVSHSNNNNNLYSSSTSARRSSDNLLPPPDSVVPQWKPSQRVLALKPDQVPHLLLSLLFTCLYFFRAIYFEIVYVGANHSHSKLSISIDANYSFFKTFLLITINYHVFPCQTTRLCLFERSKLYYPIFVF